MPELVSRIVEVCIFRFNNQGPEYLMLRRAPTEDLYPDVWQFVSGGIEPGETAAAAALRETMEETGLKAERFWVLPHVNVFYDACNDVVHHDPVFVIQVSPDAVPMMSKEHSLFEWCTRERAQQLLVWPGQMDVLELTHACIVAGKPAAGLSELSTG